jgi:hypothetical protein
MVVFDPTGQLLPARTITPALLCDLRNAKLIGVCNRIVVLQANVVNYVEHGCHRGSPLLLGCRSRLRGTRSD